MVGARRRHGARAAESGGRHDRSVGRAISAVPPGATLRPLDRGHRHAMEWLERRRHVAGQRHFVANPPGIRGAGRRDGYEDDDPRTCGANNIPSVWPDLTTAGAPSSTPLPAHDLALWSTLAPRL